MPIAARMGDMVIHMGPHCHAPIHPPALVPTPLPHPPVPMPIVKGQANVLIGGQPAARITDTTGPCTVGCIPGPPGMVSKGSSSVTIGFLPAARVMDQTTHPGCAGPIPGVSGMIQGPGCPTVLIGG